MTRLLLLFFIVAMISCDFPAPTPATDEQKKQAMNNVLFNPSIINKLAQYKKLKVFLENNLDP